MKRRAKFLNTSLIDKAKLFRDEIVNMKMMDCVEVIVEKEKYAKDGVHKGMQGVIWLEESIDGTWDVFFDLWGEHAPIGDISVKEEDLKLIPRMDARINEKNQSRIRGLKHKIFLHRNIRIKITHPQNM